MEFSSAEADYQEAAKKDVANQLTRPEQLERLGQYRRKIARKKATVESQLRNAVQTQLDGVQDGLESLKEAEKVVREIKESMSEVEQLYQQCSELSEVVRPIKDVNRRHQQLKTTSMHLQNIFNVPQVVSETYDLIKDGQLLEAHRNLSELEHTRDELLMQLYQSEDAFVDKNTSLHHYFEPLIGLSDALGQHLWLVMHQTTQLVTTEPKKVVTALRIIEREERADTLIEEMLKEKSIPLSQLPGRPKKWKEKCFEILETSISNKFDELQPQAQERMENKGWLGEHLTAVASRCYRDLSAMRESGKRCFPPDYKILTFFVTHYHASLVKVISDLVHMDLNARDIITLMVWVGDVRESFLESLGIDFSQIGTLIDPTIEEDLQKTCHKQVEANIQELVSKLLETEKEDWDSTQPPEADVNGAYYTTLGITLFQMVEQNTVTSNLHHSQISALSPLGMETKLKVLEICLDVVIDFQEKFKEQVGQYYKQHIQSGRREPPFFINYIIAIANSCKASIEFSDQLKKRFSLELSESAVDTQFGSKFKQITDEFDTIGHKCCDHLVEIAFMDLQPVLQGLMTKEAWFGNPLDLINKVEGTLVDYNSDFTHLKQAYHSYVIVEAYHRVLHHYLQALMQKRMVFKKDKDREKGAQLIRDEAKKISTMFLRLSHATSPKYIQVLELLAELISSKLEFLPLEVSSLASKHPDVKSNHIIAVLAMRGDLGRAAVTKLMQQTTLRDQSPEVDKQPSTVSLRKREGEKNILESVSIPNPLSLFGK